MLLELGVFNTHFFNCRYLTSNRSPTAQALRENDSYQPRRQAIGLVEVIKSKCVFTRNLFRSIEFQVQ